MLKKIFFLLILLATSTIEAQDPSSVHFDYLIEIEIHILDEHSYTMQAHKPIPDEFYRNEIVGFKFRIYNKKGMYPPHFEVKYVLTTQFSKAWEMPINGAQGPIIIVPPPPSRDSSFVNYYEFISDKHYLLFNSNSDSFSLDMTSAYYWNDSLDPPHHPINDSIYKEITIKNPLPDLKVISSSAAITVDNGNAVGLQSACVIANVGREISRQTTVNHYISTDTIIDKQDIFLSNRDVISLEPQESQDISIAYRHIQAILKPDTKYYLLYEIDPTNTITELNELNNISYTLLSENGHWQESIQLFPNPAQNKISISEVTTEKLLIYDMYGFLVGTKQFTYHDSDMKRAHTYDISQLSSGIYYCHIHKNGQKTVKTFIKE